MTDSTNGLASNKITMISKEARSQAGCEDELVSAFCLKSTPQTNPAKKALYALSDCNKPNYAALHPLYTQGY